MLPQRSSATWGEIVLTVMRAHGCSPATAAELAQWWDELLLLYGLDPVVGSRNVMSRTLPLLERSGAGPYRTERAICRVTGTPAWRWSLR